MFPRSVSILRANPGEVMWLEYGFDESNLGNKGFQRRFNPHGQGIGGRRTALARPLQANLNDVVLVDIHQFEVASIGPKPRPNVFLKYGFHAIL